MLWVMNPNNKTLVIWILGALATVSPFAIDLYLPAFSELAKRFSTTTAQVSLTVSSYFIGMAVGQILYGPLLDRFGRKLPLYAGLMIFIAASLACIFAQSIEQLIAFRAIQALGGSVAWVAAVALVRDLFPAEESARIFSLLVLILGVSPLLAPTVGGFLTVAWGYPAVFIALALIAAPILLVVWLYLPPGQEADTGVSLHLRPIFATFGKILAVPQFSTYAFSGAFSFATLFIYVAGSPAIFMDHFGISATVYGGIFALLSVSFITSSQLSIPLTRQFGSRAVFRAALIAQVACSSAFLLAALVGWLNIYVTFAFFFGCLACIGLTNPNATALALAPFTRNVGSASALLGFTQIGVSALASAGVGFFASGNLLPIVGLLTGTTWLALLVLLLGQKKIGNGHAIAGEAGVQLHV